MLYLDVTSSCKSPMNTGVQRVVRGLYRALAAHTAVQPLVWDPALDSYCTLSRREHGFLVDPFDRETTAAAEPGRRANPVPLWSKFARRLTHRFHRLDLAARLTAADTLFVPEIFQDNRVAWLEALAARRVGVCHDALPWRRPGDFPAAPTSTLAPAARRVGMCYDALTWRRPDITPPARRAGFTEYLNALGHFDHVVTISQESAADLRACWREHGQPEDAAPPVSVFAWPADHDGAARRFVPPPDVVPTGRRSVLCVGTFEPRKNHLLLLDAAERVWEQGVDFELVLVGRTTAQWGARVVAALEARQAAGRPVRWLRHVDDTALRRAYETCVFTVFPSVAEGYGIPIVESLWHGRPCLCGSNGALGEVAAGGGCLTVDQTDPAAVAASLVRLLTEPALYGRLCVEARDRTFGTWEGLAQQLLPLLAGVPAEDDPGRGIR